MSKSNLTEANFAVLLCPMLADVPPKFQFNKASDHGTLQAFIWGETKNGLVDPYDYKERVVTRTDPKCSNIESKLIKQFITDFIILEVWLIIIFWVDSSMSFP